MKNGLRAKRGKRQKSKEPNMALESKELKDQKGGLRAHLSKSLFGKEREEKKGRELGLRRRSSFGVIPSYFLLLKDQATYKRIFEEIHGMNTNPNFTLL